MPKSQSENTFFKSLGFLGSIKVLRLPVAQKPQKKNNNNNNNENNNNKQRHTEPAEQFECTSLDQLIYISAQSVAEKRKTNRPENLKRKEKRRKTGKRKGKGKKKIGMGKAKRMVEKLYIETKAEAGEGLDERLPLDLTRPGCNGYQSHKFNFRCCVYV